MPQAVKKTKKTKRSTNPPDTTVSYVVLGRITAVGRKSVGSLRLQLYDRSIGRALQVGETVTDDNGEYRLEVPVKALKAQNKSKPDWLVLVLLCDAPLLTSDVRYDAAIEETIDIELPADVAGLPTEYDTLVKAVGSHFAGAHARLVLSDDRQDIAYLANKTGWDAEKLAMMSLADQASAAAGTKIPANLFYALFRAGVPADLHFVCRHDESTLRRLWQESSDQGIIAKPADKEVKAAVKQLHAMRVEEFLNVPALEGTSSMKDMLALAKLDGKQQQQFANLYTTHSGNLPRFWATARTTFGKKTTSRLQLHGQLAVLTLNNAPLMRSLDGKGDTQDLALSGLHRPKMWRELLTEDVPIPATIQGDTPENRRDNYAAYLAAQLRLSHPTAAVAEIVRSRELPLEHAKPVADFLTEHLGRFEIGVQPVDQFLAKEGIALAPETRQQVKRLQRVYQLTQADQAMATLLKPEVKLDSAYHIARHTQEGFVNTYGKQLGDDPKIAERIHDKATQIHSAALNIAVSYITSRQAAPLGISPPAADNTATAGHFLQPVGSQAAVRGVSSNVIAYPTLEDLFGTVDYATSNPCRSVLSPAAYLVDLLDFTEGPAQDELFKRRPDLQHLKLTCENTNTPLPYIDLVNEVLEYFVAMEKPSLDGYAGHNTGDIASEDLLAGPQNVIDAAYGKLKTAFFPTPLPYNQPLETLRRHFAQSRMPLAKAMERLRPWNGLERGRETYGWRDILAEELEISRREYLLLTDSSSGLKKLYGFDTDTDDLTVIAELSNAKKFCRRVGISYDDLVSLLKTRFINPSVDLLPKLQRLGVPFAALQALNDGALSDVDFKALLPTGDERPDPAHYGDNIINWVKTNYTQISSLLTLTSVMPGSESDFGSYELSYAINPAFVNANFEIPSLPESFEYNPINEGVGWRFIGNAGIQGNNSDWGAAIAPVGKQTAFIQSDGSMAQDIVLNQGFYLLSFRIARRAFSDPAGSVQPVLVRVDGTSIGRNVVPSSTSFEPAAINFAVTASGQRKLTFSGTDASGDKTSFIDAVSLVARPNATTFLCLLRFIRLWKKTGWTIAQTDEAICALFRADLAALTSGDVDSAAKLDAGFKLMLPRLGTVKRTLETLGLTAESNLFPLLACWSTINTYGATTLYRQMFLNPTITKLDAAFVDNGYGEVLIDNAQTLAMHEKTLCGTLGMTHDDFSRITAHLGYADGNAPLNLANVSALHRHAWLAGKLGISVQEFLLLIAVIKLDPFTAPDVWADAAIMDDRFDITRRDEPPIARFIAWVNKFKEMSLDIKDTVALIWNIDEKGKPLTQFAESKYHELIRNIRADFVAIDVQSSASGGTVEDTASARIALAYGKDAGSGFVALIKDTQDFSVAYTHAEPALGAEIHAADAALSYDLSSLRLSHKGRMTDAQLDALQALAGVSKPFKEAVQTLFDEGAAGIPLFFSRYPELLTVYKTYSEADAEKWLALLAKLHNVVTERRKREKALSRLAAFAGTDLESARSLLDPVLPAGAVYPLAGDDMQSPALVYAMNIDQQGLHAEFFYAATATGEAAEQDFHSANLDYSSNGSHPLPSNPAAPAAKISGRWSGWLEAPESGSLSVSVDADRDAKVMLSLDGASQSIAQNGTTWVLPAMDVNAGQLVQIVLTVENVHDRMALLWQTPTRSRETIAARYLYSGSSDKSDTWLLGNMVRLFENATRLAQTVGLTAKEIAYLSTTPEYCITYPPSNEKLGWLNFISNQHDPAWGGVADKLAMCLRALLEFARIKSAWSPRSDNLLAVLKDPAAATEGEVGSLFQRVSGQPRDALLAVLGRVSCTQADLAKIGFLRYVFDAFAPLRALAIPAATTIAATTNDPTPAVVTALLHDARANFDASSWRQRVRPVNDELRALQRDALVAYILQAFRLQPDKAHIDTPDKLFEYFLMDVAMEPCMQTSRVRHALSSVQLFIERCMLNLEPTLAACFDGEKRVQWTWMKRYRVWEAQRRVFLYPENWLEPELRDDKSPFFKELEEELLQSDITDVVAEQALLTYLAKLREVSRLEPCGLFVDGKSSGTSDKDPATVHVVARTFGTHRIYYQRRQEYGVWTPWETIKLDIEDAPVIPAVWKGRQLLFWLKIVKSMELVPSAPKGEIPDGSLTQLKMSDLITGANVQSQDNRMVSVGAVLHWSEYCKGKWEKPRTSEIHNPIGLGRGSASWANAFRSSDLVLTVDVSDESKLSLVLSYPSNTADAPVAFPLRFELVSTNGVLNVDSSSLPILSYWQRSANVNNQNKRFELAYTWLDASSGRDYHAIHDLINLVGNQRFIQHQPYSLSGSGFWSDSWLLPFIYQDGQNVFFVKPSRTSLPSLPRIVPLDQTIAYTGNDGAYVAVNGSLSSFTAAGGAMVLSFGDFTFDYPNGPSTMQIDLRFILDGTPLDPIRREKGVQRITSTIPNLAAGSHTLSVEARTVQVGGPPENRAGISGNPNLSAAAPVPPPSLPRIVPLDQTIAYTGNDGAYVAVNGSLSSFTAAGGAMVLSFGDFTFDYPNGPSTMQIDLRFILDGTPLDPIRREKGVQRITSTIPNLAAGSHTLSVEARTVQVGGPPENGANITGNPYLSAAVPVPPPSLPRNVPLVQTIAYTGNDGPYVPVNGSLSSFTAAGGAMVLSFGDFTFDYPNGPSTMQIDLRFILDGTPLDPIRREKGVQRITSTIPNLAAGSHTLSVEARTVQVGGPPENGANITGNPYLSAAVPVPPPSLPRNVPLDQTIAYTGNDGAYVAVNGSLSSFTAAGGAMVLSFGDFTFDYPNGPSTMQIDLRFILDGTPLDPIRREKGVQRITSTIPNLAAGSHTLSVEARTVQVGGPPENRAGISGNPNLSAAAPVPPPSLPRIVPLDQTIAYTGNDGAYVAVNGSLSSFTAAGGAMVLSFGDFTFDYPNGPSTMQIDLRFILDGTPLDPIRREKGVQRITSTIPNLAAGSHTLSVEARTVQVGGPPENRAGISGNPNLSAAVA